MTESIQNDSVQNDSVQNDSVQNDSVQSGSRASTLCAERPMAASELGFWRFAAEQYGIWLDDEQWCELAELDDHLLIARRFFWRLSDPEVHELLCAVPDRAG